jgi:hypothetical protein
MRLAARLRSQAHSLAGVHRPGATIISDQAPDAPAQMRVGVVLHPLKSRNNFVPSD